MAKQIIFGEDAREKIASGIKQAARAVKMLLDEGKYDAIFATAADCPNFNKAFGPKIKIRLRPSRSL